MEGTDNKIIDFSKAVSVRPRKTENHTRAIHCSCWRVEIDDFLRVIECKDCGKTWGAFDWIMKVAKYEQNIFSTIQGLRKELGELKEEIGHRKRELSSLNGKIQRRSKKLRESN